MQLSCIHADQLINNVIYLWTVILNLSFGVCVYESPEQLLIQQDLFCYQKKPKNTSRITLRQSLAVMTGYKMFFFFLLYRSKLVVTAETSCTTLGKYVASAVKTCSQISRYLLALSFEQRNRPLFPSLFTGACYRPYKRHTLLQLGLSTNLKMQCYNQEVIFGYTRKWGPRCTCQPRSRGLFIPRNATRARHKRNLYFRYSYYR